MKNRHILTVNERMNEFVPVLIVVCTCMCARASLPSLSIQLIQLVTSVSMS